MTTLALSIPTEVYSLAWLVLLTGLGLWVVRVVDRAFTHWNRRERR